MVKHTFVRYIFDPENKKVTWSKKESNKEPVYQKVTHLAGSRYFLDLPGFSDTPKKNQVAMRKFRDFYEKKLIKSCESLKKAAYGLEFFDLCLVGVKPSVFNETDEK